MTLRTHARTAAGCLLAAGLPVLAFAQQTAPPAVPPTFPEVPADVFFPDPFAVFGDDTPVPGAAPVAAVATAAPFTPAASPTPTPSAPAAPEVTATDWASLLPAADLDQQVRAVMAELAENSRDVQTYNNSYLSIPPVATELAALFAVGARYEEGVPWSDSAAALAQKAQQIVATDLRRGAGGQKQVADPLGTLDSLLNGGGRGSGGTVEFSKATDFSLLMKRFERGKESLKSLASSEPLLESNREAVQREARVLAILSEISADESLEWGSDQDFAALSRRMTTAASATAEAAGKDFDTFDAARRQLSQTCLNCHGEYRD